MRSLLYHWRRWRHRRYQSKMINKLIEEEITELQMEMALRRHNELHRICAPKKYAPDKWQREADLIVSEHFTTQEESDEREGLRGAGLSKRQGDVGDEA